MANFRLASLSLLSLILLFSAFPFSPSSAESQPSLTNWLTLSPPGEEFSVQLPVLPDTQLRVSDKNPTVKIGDVRIKNERVYAAYAEGVVYLIESYESDRPENVLQELMSRYNRGFSGSAERELSGAGFRGKQFISKSENFYQSAHFLATKSRTYVFTVAARSGSRTSIFIFISSIKINNTAITPALPGTNEAQEKAKAEIPAPPSGEEQIHASKDLSHKATIVYRPTPQYTEEARQQNVTGEVMLRAVLVSDGRVTNITPIKRLPDGLTESAVTAIKAIKFLPAEKDGRVVSQYITVVYNFNIY